MKPRTVSAAVALVAAGLLLLGVLPDTKPDLTLTYVYSTDFADLIEPQIAAFNDVGLTIQGRRIQVQGVALNSGSAMTDIQAGNLVADAWTPAASVWGNLFRQRASGVNISKSGSALVQSPQVIAMWAPCADALGWSSESQPSWQQVIHLADTGGAGKPHCQHFTLGGTDPNKSTSGLLALASWYDLANGDAKLTLGTLNEFPNGHKRVRAVEQVIVAYLESSPEAMDHICADKPPYLSAIYLQENTLVTNNNPDCLWKVNPKGMVGVYPRGGTYVADYPFYIMTEPETSPDTQQAVIQFEAWLRGQLTPERVGAYGFRIPGAAPAGLVDPAHGALPDQPHRSDVFPMPPGDVAHWLQNAWQADCGSGDCHVS